MKKKKEKKKNPFTFRDRINVRAFRLRIAIHIKALPISTFLYFLKQGYIYSPKSLGTIPKF